MFIRHLLCPEYLSSLNLLTFHISVRQLLSFPSCKWGVRLMNLPSPRMMVMVAVNIYMPIVIPNSCHVVTYLIFTVTLESRGCSDEEKKVKYLDPS